MYRLFLKFEIWKYERNTIRMSKVMLVTIYIGCPVLGDLKSKIEEKATLAQSRNHASLFSTVHGIIYQQRQTIQSAPCSVPLPPPGQKQMMDSDHLKCTTTKRPTRRIPSIIHPKINNLYGVHKRGFPPARIYNKQLRRRLLMWTLTINSTKSSCIHWNKASSKKCCPKMPSAQNKNP